MIYVDVCRVARVPWQNYIIEKEKEERTPKKINSIQKGKRVQCLVRIQ